MPVLVSDQFGEVGDGLGPVWLQRVAGSPSPGAEAIAESFVWRSEVGEGGFFSNRKTLESLGRSCLGDFAGSDDDFFQVIAEKFVTVHGLQFTVHS
jgi:hypothetical protein